jgi:hypothetical protein
MGRHPLVNIDGIFGLDVFHFKFIKSAIAGNATREQFYRLAIGLIALIVLIALAVAPVVSPVSQSPDAQFGRHLNR